MEKLKREIEREQVRDLYLIPLTGPLVDDGQRSPEVPGRWYHVLSRHAVQLESGSELIKLDGYSFQVRLCIELGGVKD
ncbi:hypothetical protein ACFX2B_013152 [Malus domestica]